MRKRFSTFVGYLWQVINFEVVLTLDPSVDISILRFCAAMNGFNLEDSVDLCRLSYVSALLLKITNNDALIPLM